VSWMPSKAVADALHPLAKPVLAADCQHARVQGSMLLNSQRHFHMQCSSHQHNS
jgi:hypothetical protein